MFSTFLCYMQIITYLLNWDPFLSLVNMFIVIALLYSFFSECVNAMHNCSQCSAYNLCTACDGDLVVNGTGDGCTGKMNYYMALLCSK